MDLTERAMGRHSGADDHVPGACAPAARDQPFLSVIVPVLNEAVRIESQLQSLQALRAGDAEIIVADGGSTDGTADLAAPLADRVVLAPRGRASQMNAGAECARGSWLLFLHADTQLPDAAGEALVLRLRSTNVLWGRFDVAISGRHPLLPVVAWFMNRRSRLTGIATGDQAIFVRSDVFRRAGGYPDLALMEDIALSARLKRLGRPLCLGQRVITSGRRWTSSGVLRIILLMWLLRLAFFFGADSRRLARLYGYVPRAR